MGAETLSIQRKYRKRSQIKDIWKRLLKNKAAVIGLVIIVVLVILALSADLIADYKTVIAQNAKEQLQPPSFRHIFGTDNYGRDIFARIVHGARASLTIGIVCVSISIILGGILGAIAGFFGGLVDSILMRIMDTINCIPGVLLALAIVAALGPGILNMLIAITISSTPSFARIIRSVILPFVGQDFIEASKACGASNTRIIFSHIIPNALGPIIVQATMAISSLIIVAAGLSFIGMGIQPPAPEWGSMLSQAREYIMVAPYFIAFPGIFIVLAALSFNLLGDGLRDALDPRLKN